MLDSIAGSTSRLLATIGRFNDAHIGEPSLLPRWTRGHVLSHMARQVEALCRLLDWARTGVETPQYASMEARATEIEAGARRSAAELLADVRQTATLFENTVRALPDAAWDTPIRPRTGEWCTAERVLFIRLRELEVHHADLEAGYSFTDIPSMLAEQIIEDIIGTLSAREDVPGFGIRATDTGLHREVGKGEADPTVSGSQADLLAWLSGRSTGTDLAVIGGDGALPRPPHWI